MSPSSAATAPLILPSDVRIIPAGAAVELYPDLKADASSFVVGRRGARAPDTLIDAAGADLLRLFATPRTIAEAMVEMGQSRNVAPHDLLESTFDFIAYFVNAALLVPTDSELARPLEPRYAAGSRIGALRVVRAIRLAIDSEVYEVRDGGTRRCLKIARLDSVSSRHQIEHEGEVLRYIDGDIAPRVCDSGTHESHAFVLMTWHDGDSLDVVARRGGTIADRVGRQERLDHARALTAAYATLHALGIVHGDVNPANVIIGRRGEIVLVDFALAGFIGGEVSAPRGAAPCFWDPELAAALADRRTPLPASPASDQYALGALLYYLITGRHHLDFTSDQSAGLRQVCTEPPRTFADRGLTPWPALEGLLRRMLAKDTAARFSSVGEAESALRDIRLVPEPTASARGSGRQRSIFVDRFLRRLGMDQGIARAGLAAAPLSSLDSGASGLAFALYRIASRRDDAQIAALADVWTARASAVARRHDAYGVRDAHGGQRPAGRSSLFHAPPGTHFARAHVAHACGDTIGRANAVATFVRAASRGDEEWDIVRGRAGILMGCAQLRRLPGLDQAQTTALERLAATVSSGLRLRVQSLPPIEAAGALPLGMAHGWGGMLYAQLQWHETMQAPVADWIIDRLDQLASCAVPARRGLGWPWIAEGLAPGVTEEFMPGWCNGSGGLVFAWSLAHELTGASRFRDLAVAAAWNAWLHDTMASDLCCGAAGRAYAMLAVWRITGDQNWIRRAYRLADRAIERAQSRPRDPMLGSPESLMRGAAGIAVLVEDLAAPEWARMPVVESERWPAVASAGATR